MALWRCLVEVETASEESVWAPVEADVREALEHLNPQGWDAKICVKFIEGFASVSDAEKWDRENLPEQK